MSTSPAQQRLAGLLRDWRAAFPWMRAAVLGGVLATVAAFVVIVASDRRYQVHAALHLAPHAAPSPHAWVEPLVYAADMTGAARPPLRWHTTTEKNRTIVHLEVESDQPAEARDWLNALGEKCIALHEADAGAAAPAPPFLEPFRRQRAALAAQIAESARELEALARSAGGLVLERRRELVTALATRREAWQQAAARHVAAHDAVALLLAAGAPKGTITPAEQQQAEQDDLTLQQDRKELEVKRIRIRRELDMATAAARSALPALRSALDRLRSAVAKQRKQPNELELAALLEQIEVDAGDYRAATTEFETGWNERAAALAARDAPDHAERLLDDQAALASLAVDHFFEVDKVVRSLDAQIEAIARDGEQLTVRLVIQNALRGAHAQVGLAGQRVRASVGAMIRDNNFRLDAACRSAAGLGRRIGRHRAATRATLQQQADRVAAEQHQTRIAQAREQQAVAATARDAALADVIATVEETLELDPPFVAVVQAGGRLEATRERVAGAKAELARLDERIAAAEPNAAPRVAGIEYTAAVAKPILPPGRILGRVVAAVVLSFLTAFAAVAATVVRLPDPARE